MVNPPAANTGTRTAVTRTSAAASTKVFNFNPYAMNINSTTTKGSKLYSKATKVLPLNQRFKVSIENGLTVRTRLENDRLTYT